LWTPEAKLRISTVEDTVTRHDQVLIQLQKDNAYLNKVDQMENVTLSSRKRERNTLLQLNSLWSERWMGL
jgi:hypothetical protein